MAQIIGIAGSLRQDSLNRALLHAAKALAPDDCDIVIGSIGDIPLYNGDAEQAQGVPPAVATLKDRIAAADGLLLATPEYNNSIPGVFKNAIDWLSRPPGDIARVFAGKPVALMGASPGRLGTAFAQTAWLPVLRALGTKPWFGQTLYVSGAHQILSSEGELTDDATAERLQNFLINYLNYIKRQ
jgi:NAD(P)H-dependent FMN reductase